MQQYKEEKLEKQYTPFVRTRDTTSKVMLDVIIALIPCIVMSYFAFGQVPVMVVLVAIGSAMLAEFLFSAVFLGKTDSLSDGSAIVTGILMAFTIAPFLPLHVVAFGAAMAVIFSKLLWGGLGRNMFNPALVGREFMTIFFPIAMTSRTIWYDKTAVNLTQIDIFGNDFFNSLFFKPSGAIGEYSVLFLVLGGLYLLIRRRISWYIPLALLATFTALLFVFSDYNITFSLGGLLLGTIFMATDMPSSATTRWGKLYYGAMIGLVAIVCIINGVKYEYMSYSILLINAFALPIDWCFRPIVWSKKINMGSRIWQTAALTAGIVAATIAVIFIHKMEAMQYVIFAYIAYCIIRYIMSDKKKVVATE